MLDTKAVILLLVMVRRLSALFDNVQSSSLQQPCSHGAALSAQVCLISQIHLLSVYTVWAVKWSFSVCTHSRCWHCIQAEAEWASGPESNQSGSAVLTGSLLCPELVHSGSQYCWHGGHCTFERPQRSRASFDLCDVMCILGMSLADFLSPRGATN